MTKYYTDAVFGELGDEVTSSVPPNREVEILFWDMNSLVTVMVQCPHFKMRAVIERSYIIDEYGTLITTSELNEIQAENFLKLRYESMKMQKTVAAVLAEGGTNIKSWFEKLAEQQRCLASKTNMSRNESDDLTDKL